MKKKQSRLPEKRTMNLYYKADRTTKPATIALYVLFALVVLLGLCKPLVYDVIQKVDTAEHQAAGLRAELDAANVRLAGYEEVEERYIRYSATEEEDAQIDRMEVLDLLDGAVGASAQMSGISVSDNTVIVRFSGVTLAETAQIVQVLEQSPIVEGTTVNTASTDGQGGSGSIVSADILIHLQKEAAEQ